MTRTVASARTLAGARTLASGYRRVSRSAPNSVAVRSGVDSYIRLGTAANLDSLPFTFAAWIKPAPGAKIFSYAYSFANNRGYSIELNASNVRVLSGSSFQTYSAAFPRMNDWQHLAITFDGTSVILIYIDGTLVQTNTMSPRLADLTATRTVFMSQGPGSTGGAVLNMKEALIAARVLTQAEIVTMMATGTPPGTILDFYPMTEGSGTAVATTTGSGNNGLLTGSVVPSWSTDTFTAVRTLA